MSSSFITHHGGPSQKPNDMTFNVTWCIRGPVFQGLCLRTDSCCRALSFPQTLRNLPYFMGRMHSLSPRLCVTSPFVWGENILLQGEACENGKEKHRIYRITLSCNQLNARGRRSSNQPDVTGTMYLILPLKGVVWEPGTICAETLCTQSLCLAISSTEEVTGLLVSLALMECWTLILWR